MITALPLAPPRALPLDLARQALVPAVIAAPVAAARDRRASSRCPNRASARHLGAHDALTLVAVRRALPARGRRLSRRAPRPRARSSRPCSSLTPRRFLAGDGRRGRARFRRCSPSHAAREIDRLSHRERISDFGTSDHDWIDQAGVAPVLLLDTGEQPSTSIARLASGTRSIRTLRAPRRRSGTGAAAATASRSAETAHSWTRGRGGQRAARPVARDALPTASELASSPPTDSRPGYGALAGRRAACGSSRVPRASRRSATSGARRSSSTRAALGRSSSLAREGRAPGPDLGVNGFPWLTVQAGAGRALVRRGSVAPAPPGSDPCLFELESDGLVGSTRVEWVPGRLVVFRRLVVQRRSAPRSRRARRRPRTRRRRP